MLCTHNTTTTASLDYCHKLTNPYLHQFSSISSGSCIIHRNYVSSFAKKKGPTKVSAKGGLDHLLTPGWGATDAIIQAQESTRNDHSSDPHQDLTLPLENDDNKLNPPAPPQPVALEEPPHPQQELLYVATCQTCSGRVCWAHSWEVTSHARRTMVPSQPPPNSQTEWL